MGTREASVEKYLINEIKNLNGLCEKWGTDGFPDRIVFLKGKTYFVEIKTVDGELRPIQKLQIKRIEQTGNKIYILRGHRDVSSFIDMVN